MYWDISIDYINENPYPTWDRYQPTLPLPFKVREREREKGGERGEETETQRAGEKKQRRKKKQGCQCSSVPQSLRSGLIQHFHVKNPQMDTLYAKGPHLIGLCPWDSQYFIFYFFIVVVVVIDLALRCKTRCKCGPDLSVRVKPLLRHMFVNRDNFRLMKPQSFILSGWVTHRTAFADLWGSWIPPLRPDWLEMSKCFQMRNDSASPDDNN